MSIALIGGLSEPSATSDVPNRPMVPTAPTAPTANSLRPMRRHIGQPLGSLERGAATPFEQQNLGHESRAKNDVWMDNGLRPTGMVHGALSGKDDSQSTFL